MSALRVWAAAVGIAACLAAPAFADQKPPDVRTSDPDAAIKAAAEAARAAEARRSNWKVGRTPWGDPDLRGYWLTATYTPLERPKALGDKALYTPEEALAAFKSAVVADAGNDPAVVHYDWKEYGMDAWQSPVRPNPRTSLIIDPPDGQRPPYSAAARQRQAAERAALGGRMLESSITSNPGLYSRCITGNNAGPMLRGGNPGSDQASAAAGVTAEIQLFQSPGYVVVMTQSNNDARIIPLAGGAHLPQQVHTYLGDSRGRWEGTTLVVETTNFNEPATRFRGHGSTPDLKLTERFTLIDPNTLNYEFTLDDPATWSRPWTAVSPLPRVEPPLYEFACHEHNYGIINVVRGAQVRDREAAAKKESR